MAEAMDWVSPPPYEFKGYGLFAASTVIEQEKPYLGQIVWEQDACSMSDNWATCVNPGPVPPNTGGGTLTAALGASTPQSTVVTFTLSGFPANAVVQVVPGDGMPLPATVTVDGTGAGTLVYDYLNPGVYNAQAASADQSTIAWTQVNIMAALMPKVIPGPQYGHARGFAVYNGITCNKLGLLDEVNRAQRRLMYTEERQVEACLMSGQAGNFPYLAGGPNVQVLNPGATATTALSLVDGLGWLEGELGAQLGPQGLIHASRYLAPSFAAAWQTQMTGNAAVSRSTTAGTKVVFGSGYPALGPDGKIPDPAVSWIYASGPIVIYRAPVITVEVFAGTSSPNPTNQVIVLAERQYMIQMDCPILAVAVKVNRPPHVP